MQTSNVPKQPFLRLKNTPRGLHSLTFAKQSTAITFSHRDRTNREMRRKKLLNGAEINPHEVKFAYFFTLPLRPPSQAAAISLLTNSTNDHVASQPAGVNVSSVCV
ncbi:hypothetical protein E2C01_020151 [Portunus trituberculatus]|uniref:Uncharacterized protein n=1 Tax=Portunus trituberculatus TaxID=210409 RepID=A0A5B7DZE9_PORTR|nr:hypothetical protein [Portunus trituberculatus]